MATIDNYKVKIDVEGQDSIDRLKNSLGGLGSVIAGIGFGAFIASAFKAADAIGDVADATGIAVGQVAALADSLKLAGGNADDVGKILTTFYGTLSEAANGSEKAQDALGKVGIKLNDLTKLSEGELLTNALSQLASMDEGAKRTTAGVDLFGKAFRNIDPKKLQEILDTKDVTKFQQEFTKAGQVIDNLQANFGTLQKAVLTALTPLIGQTDNFKLSLEQAERIVKIVGATLTVVFGAKAVVLIADVVAVVLTLNKALASTAAITALIGKNPLVKIFAGAAVAAGIGAVAWNEYEKAIDDAAKAQDAIGGTTPAGAPAKKPAFDTVSELTKQELQARKTALTTAQQMTDQIKRQNVQAEYYQQTINDTIGLMDVEASKIKMNAQLDQDAANKLIDLNKQIEIEKSKGRGTNQAVILELEKQKTEIQLHLEITKRLKEEEINRLDVLERQRNVIKNTAQAIQEGHDNLKLSNANNMQSQVILGKMTQEQANREKDLENIRIDTSKKTEALAAQRLLATTQREKDSIDQQIKMAEDQQKMLIYLTEQRYALEDELRQSSTAGAVAALEQIKRSTDPFMVAQNSITTLFRGMESALDKFVDTGKLSFGDFAESVIKDLIKIQLKAAATNFMSAGLSMLGFGIPGKAEGGPVSGNSPYIVGEQGPELFIPKMAGNIVPNNKLGSVGAGSQQPSNTYITNNISAVDAKSVAQLFAENRKTLLGSIKMAEKEMPYRMR